MDQEVLKKIQATLALALGVEEEEATLEASLTKDLGAESIDFIDIIFRLEKEFDIKIPSGDLFPASLLNDERFVSEGKVTEAGMSELKVKYPYLNLENFSKDPQVALLADLFTVGMVAEYIQSRLQEKTEA